jgi:phosphoglycolate phosphatase
MSTIIFDFDGTLHDSMYIYRIALNRGYQWLVDRGEARPRELTEADMAANIGLTSEEAWTRMCPEIPWEVSRGAAAQVGIVMDELIDNGTARLFPGVPAMLQQVKDAGHTLVFLSNCRNAYRDAVRRAFGFDAWFDAYYTAEQFGGIPKEQIFETIRQEVPGPYIVVGDRGKDLAVARVHDLPCIGCLYGYGSREELAGSTFLAESPSDIPALIQQAQRVR